jgi:hypothetical protein
VYDQKKSEEKVFLRKLMANLNKYFMQHLVTDTIHGPSEGELFLNIQHTGLNGGKIQIGQTQTSGKPQVMMSLMIMIKTMLHAV